MNPSFPGKNIHQNLRKTDEIPSESPFIPQANKYKGTRVKNFNISALKTPNNTAMIRLKRSPIFASNSPLKGIAKELIKL